MEKPTVTGAAELYPLRGITESASGDALFPRLHADQENTANLQSPFVRQRHQEDFSEEKTNRDLEWRKAFFNFSQTTTLHGVNKITEQNPFLLRRYAPFLSQL